MDSVEESRHDYYLAQWAIVGRLTVSLFHEINNPMQAIHGALSLALEDMGDAEALSTYLDLGVRESARVINLIARARRVFAAENSPVAPVDVNTLLREVIFLTGKELSNKWIRPEMQLEATVPAFTARYNELALAFICSLLAVSDEVAAGGGSEVTVATAVVERGLLIEFSAPTAVFSDDELFLPVCRPVVANYRGDVRQVTSGGRHRLQIVLPL